MAAPFSVKFGSHSHPPGEVTFSIQRQQLRSRYTGRRVIENLRWDMQIVLMDTTLSGLETKIEALETAYRTSTSSDDLLFLHADGTTNTKHTILAANTINGIEVDGPHYSDGPKGLWGFGTEYINVRTARVSLRAQALLQEGGEELVSWNETIQQVGNGGPTWIYQDAVEGPLQLQQLTPYSSVHYFQSGSAVGLTAPPIPPGPAMDLEHTDQRRVTPPAFSRPLMAGRVRSTHFPVSWFYHFEYAGFAVGP